MKLTIVAIALTCLSLWSHLGASGQTGKRQSQHASGESQKNATPETSRPALLGVSPLALSQPDYEKSRRRRKTAGEGYLQPYFQDWIPALQAATGLSSDQCAATLVTFVPRVDALWKNDQFQPALLDRLIKRLKKLPTEASSEWIVEFKMGPSKAGFVPTERDMRIIGMLIQLDTLYVGDAFSQPKSEIMLMRLRSITPDAIEGLSETMTCHPLQAAFVLIQIDSLFVKETFQQERFTKMMQEMRKK